MISFSEKFLPKVLILFFAAFSLSGFAQNLSQLKKQAIAEFEKLNFEGAKAAGIKYLEQRPEHWQMNLIVGDSEYGLKNYEQALFYYNKLNHWMVHYDVHLRRASALVELGRNDEAIEYYHKILQREPNRPEIRRFISKLYFDDGNYDLALQEINEAEKLNPKSSPTILGKAEILLKMNRTAESCNYLNRPELTVTPEVKILKQINCLQNTSGAQ